VVVYISHFQSYEFLRNHVGYWSGFEILPHSCWFPKKPCSWCSTSSVPGDFPFKGEICPYWASLCISITPQEIELESCSYQTLKRCNKSSSLYWKKMKVLDLFFSWVMSWVEQVLTFLAKVWALGPTARANFLSQVYGGSWAKIWVFDWLSSVSGLKVMAVKTKFG